MENKTANWTHQVLTDNNLANHFTGSTVETKNQGDVSKPLTLKLVCKL